MQTYRDLSTAAPNAVPSVELARSLRDPGHLEEKRAGCTTQLCLNSLASLLYVATLIISSSNEDNINKGFHDGQIKSANAYSVTEIMFAALSGIYCNLITAPCIEKGQDLFAAGIEKIHTAVDFKNKLYGWGKAALGFGLSTGSVVANYFSYTLGAKFIYILSYNQGVANPCATLSPPFSFPTKTTNVLKGIATGCAAVLSGFGLFKACCDHRANRDEENRDEPAFSLQ